MRDHSAAEMITARLRHSRAADRHRIGACRAEEQQLEGHLRPAARAAARLCSKEARWFLSLQLLIPKAQLEACWVWVAYAKFRMLDPPTMYPPVRFVCPPKRNLTNLFCASKQKSQYMNINWRHNPSKDKKDYWKEVLEWIRRRIFMKRIMKRENKINFDSLQQRLFFSSGLWNAQPQTSSCRTSTM